MDRREFTNASIMALLGGLTVTISGCSSSPSSPSSNGNPGTDPGGAGSRNATVSANHGHSGSVTSAQITAGNEITVNIRGTADHPHTVVLAMGDLGALAGGGSVTKPSSSDNSALYGQHDHMVTFS